MATSNPFLLSVFLRGAADGLTLVVPYDDPNYQQKRNLTRVFPPGSGNPGKEAIHIQNAVGTTPAFGMAPAMQPLETLYTEGKVAFVHATGVSSNSRSHFDQQFNMEAGVNTNSSQQLATGWLGRHLATTPGTGNGLLRAVSIGGILPITLTGGPLATPTPDPENYAFPGDPATAPGRRSAIEDMYTLKGEPLLSSLNNALGAIDTLAAVNWSSHTPPLPYPTSPFGDAVRKAAIMAQQLPDLEIVHTDLGGWDLHSDEGVFTGAMAANMGDLAGTLEAFLRDMEANGRPTVVLVVTEFGRTLDENSSSGTDHGRGGVSIVAGVNGAQGGIVNGGQVITQWPGLDIPNLSPPVEGGDLAVSIDIRDIQAEVGLDFLGNPSVSNLFPDTNYTYVERGVIA